MPKSLEAMAQTIVASGRLRVLADDRKNFVAYRHLTRNIHHNFSAHELHDPALKARTLAALRSYNLTQAEANAALSALQQEMAKHPTTPQWKLEKLARLFVQAAEPVVIALVIEEQAEIYISYAHNVQDFMDMASAQKMGQTGGLQSTSGQQAAIYTSCGGDPFLPKGFETFKNDGKPAMSRMLVIAAQELAHYADIMRDAKGHKTPNRFTATAHPFEARPHIKKARNDDKAATENLAQTLSMCGLKRLETLHKNVQFFEEHRTHSMAHFKSIVLAWLYQQWFNFNAKRAGCQWVAYPPKGAKAGTAWVEMLHDMAFNLEPEGYDQGNPTFTEAMICIEALARVPQQAIKWGHQATYAAMPNLYKTYYTNVIPGVRKALFTHQGTAFKPTLAKPKSRWIRKLFSQKVDYG